MRFPVLMSALALAACASAHEPQRPAAGQSARESLVLESTSWGRPFDRISIAADGTLRHEMWKSAFDNSPPREVVLALTAAQHAEAIATLAPLRQTDTAAISCEGMPTDGPYGSVTWNGTQKLGMYLPCLSLPRFGKQARAIKDFRRFIQGLEEAATSAGGAPTPAS